MGILVALCFSEVDYQKWGSTFLGGCDLHRNCGMAVILFFFLCNYNNLTLKLHQEKRSYPDEEWLFIGRFNIGSVRGKSAVLVASKKVSKSIMSMI